MISSNTTVDIYSNLSSYEFGILKKLNIKIKKGEYSLEDYAYLCIDIAQYYREIEKLNLVNVTIDEYDIILEKIYEFEHLFNYSNESKGINIYEMLNNREKYILEKLYINIDHRVLNSFEIKQVINYIHNQKKKLSNIPISQADFISAYKDYLQKEPYCIINGKTCYKNFTAPEKCNIYNLLSEKSINVISKLVINTKDKNINNQEYGKILKKHLLSIFGTGIEEKECNSLILKLNKFI